MECLTIAMEKTNIRGVERSFVYAAVWMMGPPALCSMNNGTNLHKIDDYDKCHSLKHGRLCISARNKSVELSVIAVLNIHRIVLFLVVITIGFSFDFVQRRLCFL